MLYLLLIVSGVANGFLLIHAVCYLSDTKEEMKRLKREVQDQANAKYQSHVESGAKSKEIGRLKDLLHKAIG